MNLEVTSREMGQSGGTCFSCIQKFRAAEAFKFAVQATVHPHLEGQREHGLSEGQQGPQGWDEGES